MEMIDRAKFEGDTGELVYNKLSELATILQVDTRTLRKIARDFEKSNKIVFEESPGLVRIIILNYDKHQRVTQAKLQEKSLSHAKMQTSPGANRIEYNRIDLRGEVEDFENIKSALNLLIRKSERMQTELLSIKGGSVETMIENWVKELSDPKRKAAGHVLDPWSWVAYHVYGYLWKYSDQIQFASLRHISNTILKLPPLKSGLYGHKEYENGHTCEWWSKTFETYIDK